MKSLVKEAFFRMSIFLFSAAIAMVVVNKIMNVMAIMMAFIDEAKGRGGCRKADRKFQRFSGLLACFYQETVLNLLLFFSLYYYLCFRIGLQIFRIVRVKFAVK